MNAPSVTEREVLDAIKSVSYTRLPNGRTTICQLTLDNDFTVEGKSACVSADNYDQDKGERYAYEDAFDKVWSFLGFRLADKIMREAQEQKNEQLDLPLAFNLVDVPAEVGMGDQVLFYEQIRMADGTVQVTNGMLALVADVPEVGKLNLTIIASNGTVHARVNVPLISKNEPAPQNLQMFARPWY